MTSFNNEVLADMCSKVDLLEYISNSYDISKVGENYYINCPLHKGDNTPSMIINPDTNKYYCFSCRASGSLLDWFRKVEHLSWNDSISKLQKLSGMNDVHLKQCDAITFYKQAKKIYEMKNNIEENKRPILEPEYMNNFSDEIPQEWVDEGISVDVMKQYEIKVDNKSNRIIYPLYDNFGNFVAVKGRSRFKEYKELKIAKYKFYQKIGELDFFAGWKQALPHIKETSTVYIFEGLKSVMHVCPWGYNNSISSETSYLSKGQINWLIKNNIKNVIICYDSDIELSKIKKNTEQLKKFTNVYTLLDTSNLLGGKDAKNSPCDCGKEIFEELCQTKIKI